MTRATRLNSTLRQVDAAGAYAQRSALVAGARPTRPIRGTGQLYLGTSATLVWTTERDRAFARLVNTTSQTLNVALGTLDSTAAPSSFTAVPAGSEWVTDDVRPVFAYLATSAALVITDKQVIA